MKRVYVRVYRHGDDDCTNGGVTSVANRAILFVDCERDEAIAWCKEHGEYASDQLILVRRELFGKRADYVAPLVKKSGGTYMFGGNFVYSSDSRFSEYTQSGQPIAVHDRFETWSEYEMMSR